MRFLAFAQVIFRRWWLFPLCAAIGIGLVYFWHANQPRRYDSTVTLQLNPAARSSFLPFSVDPQGTTTSVTALAASYAEVLRSRTFGELVVRELDLNASPDSIGRAIGVRLVPNTNIFRLTVTWDNPRDAERLAQGIAEVFIVENLRRQQADLGGQSRVVEMEQALATTRERIAGLRAQREQLDRQVAAGDLDELQTVGTLESRIAVLETNYNSLLVEVNRTHSSIDTASILDLASSAQLSGPWSASRALTVGLLAGLALAVGLAYLAHELDDRLRTPEDLVPLAGGPLAIIGRISTRSWPIAAQRSRLVALHARRTAAAEGFRTLRTSLRLAGGDDPPRSIVVTSASPGEGKTLVASNLAIAYAQAGQRVLLVDADLRRPGIHRVFGLRNEPGLTEALATMGTVGRGGAAHHSGPIQDELVLAGPLPNLSILPAGRVPASPGELLSIDASTELLARLTAAWDVVIVDSAPIGPVADTLLIATPADAVLVVARSGQTRRSALENTLNVIQQTGRRANGVVLNDLRLNPLDRYTSYAYYTYARQYYDRGAALAEERTNGHPEDGELAAPDGPASVRGA